MEEKKMQMFGKSHNVLGSTETDLILLTKGNIKIRWGSRKFIDLIKGGKINAEGSLILNKVASLNDIKGDGIYLISETGEVLLSIDGQVINLSNLGDSSYISFLVPLELTPELKLQALTNAGFYYLTLEDAQSANIQSGIVYIVDEKKLYLAENGLLTEFITNASSESSSEAQTFDELWIGDLLHIYNSDYSIIDAVTKLGLLVGSEEYITLGNNQVYITKDLVSNMIKSEGATSTKGYRLYYKNGKSVLEVDDIIWRNKPEDEGSTLEEATILSKHDNIIVNTTEEGECILKYLHEYKVGDKVYISVPKVSYTILAELYKNTVEVSITPTYSEKVEVELELVSGTSKKAVIEENKDHVTVDIGEDDLKSYKVIKGPDSINSGLLLKFYPKEYTVTRVTDNSIFINSIENISNARISLAPGIVIEKDNIHVVENNESHTKIGVVSDNPVLPITKPNVGIYSDNFIGIAPILYDSVFKKLNDYPKYDEVIEVPTDFKEDKYNHIVPNIAWIKELIKLAIPKGTIAMWNGVNIPEDWAICDGTNGTPDLTGKFIKAGNTAGDTGGYTEITLKEENIPAHTHGVSGSLSTNSSGAHSHTIHYKEGDLGDNANYRTNIFGDLETTTSTAGEHTHTIDMSNLTLDKAGGGKPLPWEPSYYSLIFIMKL